MTGVATIRDDLANLIDDWLAVPRQLAHILRQLDTQHRMLQRQAKKMEHLMSNQEHLDADVAAIGPQLQEVIDALKAQPGAEALDFTGLDTVVQQISDAVPDAPPAEPPA